MRIFIIFSILIGILGCASTQVREPLDFPTVAALPYGNMAAADLINTLGKPDESTAADADTIIWSYKESYPAIGLSDRLNISIDRTSQKVVGALWIPRPDEDTKKRDWLIAHFKKSKFSRKPVGLEGRHHFNRDEIYSDADTGVSFYLNTTHSAVQSVSFSQPKSNRKLSTQ